MTTPVNTSVSANMTEMMNAWKQFREEIAPEARERIANAIFSDEEVTRVSANKRIGLIMRELMMGNIPPAIEPQLRSWMQLLLLNIHTMHEEQRTPQHAMTDMRMTVLSVLEQVKPATQFLMAPRPRLIESDESPVPALAEIKSG